MRLTWGTLFLLRPWRLPSWPPRPRWRVWSRPAVVPSQPSMGPERSRARRSDWSKSRSATRMKKHARIRLAPGNETAVIDEEMTPKKTLRDPQHQSGISRSNNAVAAAPAVAVVSRCLFPGNSSRRSHRSDFFKNIERLSTQVYSGILGNSLTVTRTRLLWDYWEISFSLHASRAEDTSQVCNYWNCWCWMIK